IKRAVLPVIRRAAGTGEAGANQSLRRIGEVIARFERSARHAPAAELVVRRQVWWTMTTVELKPVSEVRPQAERVVSRVFARLAALLPDAELHHIGATALPTGVTKGDVDVLVRVPAAGFPAAVAALRRDFAVKQPDNWTAEFASFGDDAGH